MKETFNFGMQNFHMMNRMTRRLHQTFQLFETKQQTRILMVGFYLESAIVHPFTIVQITELDVYHY